MSKQSNQRFRKQLEKCQQMYMETIRNAAKENAKSSLTSGSAESTESDSYTDLVDKEE